MISPLEARILDGNAAALGVSVERLMGAAGRALAENVASAHPGERTVFVCGTGNNGGDGYAAAGILGAPVLEFGMPKSEEARRYRSLIEGRCFTYSDAYLEDYDVVVDCVLGTGARGEVREPYRSCLLAINASGRSVVSCDVPSGLGTPAAVRPEMTVTFHDAKTGMDEASCGRIVVADIGFPEDASAAVGPGDMLRYPVPERGSHKGSNGRLVVVGGGPYIGAPALAGAAALRIGADLVRMAVPERCVQPIAAAEPSLVFMSLPGPVLGADSVEAVLQSAEGADALLIGPGLGRGPGTQAAVRAIVGSCRKPMVIDADGLNAVAGGGWSFGAPAVLTPHAAELSRLAGGSGPDDARRLSEETGCTVLLKGAEDLVVQGGRSRVNRTGTPAMTVGGTGDVLAGAVAGLLAKGMAPFDAACLGAYICGRAGELAYAEMSYGATAPDVARCIGRALAEGLGRRDGPPARPRGPRAEGGPGPRRDGPAHRRRGAPRRQGVQHPVEDRRHAGGDRLRPRRLRPPDRPRRREGLRPRLDQAGVPGDTGLLRGAAGDVRHRRRRQGEP